MSITPETLEAEFSLAQAETRLDQDPRAALRLDEAAVHLHDSPDTRSALVNNLLTTPYSGTLTGHTGPVTAVAFAPDGNTLASAGDDGTVRLWNLTGLTELRDHVMRRACTITGGGLTRTEWDRYVEGLPYVDVCKT